MSDTSRIVVNIESSVLSQLSRVELCSIYQFTPAISRTKSKEN